MGVEADSCRKTAEFRVAFCSFRQVLLGIMGCIIFKIGINSECVDPGSAMLVVWAAPKR